MPTESGKLIGTAFEAVRQCHQDVGRLIADLDGHMTNEGWERLFNQDAVTWGISRAAYAPYWMAKMLYRLYRNEDAAPDIVDGINIRFFSDDKALGEPRIVIGRAKYAVPSSKTVAKVAETWDFDDGYRKWCNAQPDDLGKILSCDNKDSRVKKMCVVALDLYSITNLHNVTSKLDEVRQAFAVEGD